MTRSTRLFRLAVLSALLTPLLIGCARMTASAGIDPGAACRSFEPIGWSQNDSDATIRAVKEHNAAWRGVCRR